MISLIACVDRNYGIGKDNKLLFSFKEDMEFFKNTTMNHTVVMGYNTYKSIGTHLDGRENVVLTDEIMFSPFIGMTKKEFLEKYKNKSEEIFIIGGAKTYEYFINYADNLYLTIVNDEVEADAYFPEFKIEDYTQELLKSCKDEKNKEFFIFKYTKK